ncbi:MAG TPA: FAD-binding oxidoreductase, partial [Thermoplasmata archaeon]|nr:FAD-binding oxidoreductase [Thermoplasmata archaeon]
MAVKWWGWGAEGHTVSLKARPSLLFYLRGAIGGLEGDALPVPTPESVALPPSRLPETELAAFREILWDKPVATSHAERLLHAVGKSYRDLLRLRLGLVPSAPDAVLFPETEDQVARILSRCADRRIAVVPFGGGTSVVGGVEVAERSMPHIALDLRRMARLLDIDAVSHTATAESGILGPALEQGLAGKGLTLGHFPQSFEFSTLGGWIASRSAGAYSNRYGKIEDLVAGLRLIAPAGTFVFRARPRHAMGFDLLGLVVGSEGTLGVVSRATVRVHAAPETRVFES